LCNSAYKTLTELVNNDNKEIALESFINANLDIITNIFKKIHAPKEFSKLTFNKNNEGGLFLTRKGKEHAIPITQISTGQRSALALSIFITLTTKITKGPRFILIDDPIAHVDDLNVLSFLDYLREMAIVGNRQIFFATASRKLANLFEMKFKGLGDEKFKRIDLSR